MKGVYLLHLNVPFKHARHYCGFASDVEARIEAHRQGNGSNLMKHVRAAGIDFVVARIWEGKDRKYERWLKNRGSRARLCPICRVEAGRRKAYV